jgi:zona occludens toxin
VITFITGSPGSGKTAYMVDTLEQEVRKTGRPVFVWGIPGLKVPHVMVPPVSEWTVEEAVPEDPKRKRHRFAFPDGALVVIDEAQDIFRIRSQASAVPPHVAAFETHRHLGLDFWISTQKPQQVDAHVRGLVGRHIHLRGTWAGRTLYEWPEVSNPANRTERALAVTRPYRLPARVFGLYKSASVHIKPQRRVPFVALVIVLAVVVGGGLAWRAASRVKASIAGEKGHVALVEPGTALDVPGRSAGVLGPSVGALAPTVVGVKLEEYLPRLTARPETAPLYDRVRVVTDMPVVAGCVRMGDRCECFTQQATRAYLSGPECDAWLDAPPFNPWRGSAPSARGAAPDRGDGARKEGKGAGSFPGA